jgi:hypothetical protein
MSWFVHINVYCPTCRTRYQLLPDMRGKQMICPNPICREVFVVEDHTPDGPGADDAGGKAAVRPFKLEPFGDEPTEVEHPPEAPEKTKTAGSVGDLVPILDAEVVGEVPPPPPRKSKSKSTQVDKVPTISSLGEGQRGETPTALPSWREPPPVRNPGARSEPTLPPAETAPAPLPPMEKKKTTTLRKADVEKSKAAPVPENGPAPSAVDWQSAPPVRWPGSDGGPDDAPFPSAMPAEQPEEANLAAPAAKGRWALWVIGGMVLAAVILVGTAAAIAIHIWITKEDTLYVEALGAYNDRKFNIAAAKFENLVQEFPDSNNLARYRFLAQFCRIRDQVQTVTDPRDVFGRLRGFLEEYKGDALLKEYRTDAGSDLYQLAQQLVTLTEERHDKAILAQAREASAEAGRFEANADLAALNKRIADIDSKIDFLHMRDEFINELKGLVAAATLETVKQARNKARRINLDQDPEVRELFRGLDATVGGKVKYVVDNLPPDSAPPAVAVESSLLVAPFLIEPQKPLPESSRVVLALARGVVYALNQSDGTIHWARRVGIDTTSLPVRLPRTATAPELFLVLSADRNTVMALTAREGTVQWQHRLTAPSLGRPLIVDGKAYLPTYDGRVYEIETFLGNVLGHFELGQPLTVGGARLEPLTVGGARQEGTNLLYFPGDSDNLYVLEVPTRELPTAKYGCPKILHTGHPAGSLRGEPIIVSRSDPTARNGPTPDNYLVLSQADGLDHMKLRVFSLPIESSDASPILQPEPRIRGWSWFQPYYDREKLAFVTDAGNLGLFGVNQVKNVDPALFPMLPDEKQMLRADKQQPGSVASELGRGQVLYGASENQFWVLDNGELRQLYLRQFEQKIVTDWTAWQNNKNEPAFLGWPLHAGQFDENSKVLFVVTQDVRRQVQLATAVDATSGRVLWQRQLGMECQDAPLAVNRDVLMADRGGGLFAFQPGASLSGLDRGWTQADALVKGPIEGKGISSFFFPVDDGVYELACPAEGRVLTVRHYQPGAQAKKQATEVKFAIGNSWLAGTPALVGGPAPQSLALLLPMMPDGALHRISLAGVKESGPTWRSTQADDDARGHVVRINADEFVLTDGSRGLNHWIWQPNAPQPFHKIPDNAPPVEMHARIVAAPIVLPAANEKAVLEVCVADADGTITLLQGADLQPARSWPLGGKITAGPFLRGQYIGCVVDRRQLVWIDPSSPAEGVDADHRKPKWPPYIMQGDGIVGEPQLVHGTIVVVDLSGRIVGLDPETGKERGKAYTLKASAAPAATAVAFGAAEALVPLTDGTVFVLPLHVLGGIPKIFPPFIP